MSDDVILVLDFNSVCRFCLQSNGALSSIFSGEDNIPVSSQIESLTNISVEPDESFPSKICHRCRYKIEFCYEFREMVLRTQKALMDNISEDVDMNENKYDIETLDPNYENEILENDQTKIKNRVSENGQISKKGGSKDNMNYIPLRKDQEASGDDEYSVSLTQFSENTLITRLHEEFTASEESLLKKKSKTNKPWIQNTERKKTNSSHFKMKDYPSMLTASRRNQCLLCLEKCENTKDLRQHVDKHIVGTDLEPYYMFGDRDITCKLCDKQFGYRFSFLTHQREHLGLKPFICHSEGCELAFYSNSALRQHLPIHGDKRFICSMCAVGFKRKSDLKAHEIIHKDAGMQFHCPICKLICKNRLTLAAHVRKHCVQPRFKCDTCPKKYFSRSELERHTHIHTGEKHFCCATCPSAYFSRAALVRHERGHRRERAGGDGAEGVQRRCPICPTGGVFGTWQEYKMHMTGHGSLEFPYRCPHCQKGYFAKNSLTKHISLCGDAVKPLSDQHTRKTYVQLVHTVKEEQDIDGMMEDDQETDRIVVSAEEPHQLFIVDMIEERVEE